MEIIPAPGLTDIPNNLGLVQKPTYNRLEGRLCKGQKSATTTSVFLRTVSCRERDPARVKNIYPVRELCIIISISRAEAGNLEQDTIDVFIISLNFLGFS